MKKNKFSLNTFINENAVPVLLLTALFSSVIHIYSLSDGLVFTFLTIFSFIYSILLFLLLDFLKRLNKGWFSTLTMFILMFVSLYAGNGFIETGYRDTTQWFFEPDNFSRIYIGNIVAVIVMVGFVLGSALYYFTRVRFRFVFVFLICLCPFSLFAKSFTDIPVIFTIIIITLFFLLIISNQTQGKLFDGKNRYAAIGAFIVVISMASAFSPKLEFAPYREQFDEAITGISIVGGGVMDFNDFADSSSSARSNDEDKVLFTLRGDNPVLIKRQCFNSYDRESDTWGYYGEIDTGYNYYGHYINWENPALLASELGMEMETAQNKTTIHSESGDLRALYTHENTTSIDFHLSSLLDYSLKYVYRTPLDEYFVSSDKGTFRSYSIEWCRFEIDEAYMLLCGDEEKLSELYYGPSYLETKSEMKQYHDPLMTEEVLKECYKNEKNYNEVKLLVADIISGCDNDYQKALAIERYFKSSDFVYDDDFSTSDSSVENFLFNTKRGICTDYATAMTLMCREAGLYSRYVEGFLVQKAAGENVYNVTAADSHAYVQVWLNGYGWTDFDPTSSNIDNGYIDPTFLIVGMLMLLVATVGVVIFIVRPIMEEQGFIRKVGALRGREQLIKLYPRVSGIIHKELRLKKDVLTVNELKSAVIGYINVDISEMADAYEATVYGDVDCGNKDYFAVYTEIKKALKLKKSEERKAKRKIK